MTNTEPAQPDSDENPADPEAMDPADLPAHDDTDSPADTPRLPWSVRNPQPTRRRASLNMALADWAKIEQLAAWEHRTVHDTIRMSVETRYRIFIANRPELRWPDLDPKDRPHSHHLAVVDDVTGKITHLEVF